MFNFMVLSNLCNRLIKHFAITMCKMFNFMVLCNLFSVP